MSALTRTLATVGTAAGLLVSVAGPVPAATVATAAPACRPSVSALPLPPGLLEGAVHGGRGNDLLVGEAAEDLGNGGQPVAWRRVPNGWKVQDLSRGGTISFAAVGVDRAGDILLAAGFVVTPDGRYHRLRGFDGSAAAETSGGAINADGVIAGSVSDPVTGRDRAATWSSFGARARQLAFRGAHASFAAGINDRADVVGFAEDLPASRVWLDGHRHGAVLAGRGSVALAINGNRLIVGSKDSRAAVWSSPGSLRVLGVLPGQFYAELESVSAAGRAVGVSGAGDFEDDRAVYWRGSGPLRTLLPLGGDWAGTMAHAEWINDSGLVAGVSALRPTVWTCADEQSFVPPSGL